jgi:hypothetical protein
VSLHVLIHGIVQASNEMILASLFNAVRYGLKNQAKALLDANPTIVNNIGSTVFMFLSYQLSDDSILVCRSQWAHLSSFRSQARRCRNVTNVGGCRGQA